MSDPVLPPDDAALDELLVRLAPQPPAIPEVDNSPWDFLRRQPADVVAARVRPALMRLVLHGDPVVQRRAVEMFVNLPTEPASAAQFIDVVRGHVAELRRDPTLRAAAAHAVATLGALAGRDREAASIIRALVAPELPPVGATTPLAMFDPDYVRAAIRAAGPGAADSVAASAAAMFALYHRGQLLSFLAELAGFSTDAKERVLDRIGVFLAVDDEKGRAMAARVGLPPPTAAPSLDDCRRALGLTSSLSGR